MLPCVGTAGFGWSCPGLLGKPACAQLNWCRRSGAVIRGVSWSATGCSGLPGGQLVSPKCSGWSEVIAAHGCSLDMCAFKVFRRIGSGFALCWFIGVWLELLWAFLGSSGGIPSALCQSGLRCDRDWTCHAVAMGLPCVGFVSFDWSCSGLLIEAGGIAPDGGGRGVVLLVCPGLWVDLCRRGGPWPVGSWQVVWLRVGC